MSLATATDSEEIPVKMPCISLKNNGGAKVNAPIFMIPDILDNIQYEEDGDSDGYKNSKEKIEAINEKLETFNNVTNGKIVIPGYTADGKRVVGIDVGAFSGLTNVKELIIPETVTSIDSGVFMNTADISKVNIPYTVTSIGDAAFMYFPFKQDSGNFDNLDVTWGENIKKIPNYTFYGRGSEGANDDESQSTTVANFDFSKVNEIGENAFAQTDLNKVDLPENVETLGKGAFSYCRNIESINLSSKITTIPEECFHYSMRQEKDIGGSNFPVPVDIEIPSSVKSIEKHAFYETKIGKLVLHGGKDQNDKLELKDACFGNCDLLYSVKMDGMINLEKGDYIAWDHQSDYEDVKMGVFSSSFTTSVLGEDVKPEIILSDEITEIPDYTFAEANLASAQIVLPKGLKKIGSNAFYSSSYYCGITKILLSEGLNISDLTITVDGNSGDYNSGGQTTKWGFSKDDSGNYLNVYTFSDTHTAGAKEWHYDANGSIEVYNN